MVTTTAWVEPDAIAAVLSGCPRHVRGPADAHVLDAPNNLQFAISTDSISANQGFPGEDVRSLVRRGLIEALSDLAAVGASFHGAQIDLRAPGDFSLDDFEAVGRGLDDVFGIYGGQLLQACNMSRGEFGLSNTVLGLVSAGRAMRRAGAQPGDHVFITGPTGGWNCALAVLNHAGATLSAAEWTQLRDDFVDYRPELAFGEALAASGVVNSCTDANDSLDKCLRDLVGPLGLDADIDEAAVPLAPSARLVEREVALSSAEVAIMGLAGDNRLVLIAAPESASELANVAESLGRNLFQIGVLSAGSGMVHYRHLVSRSRAHDVRRLELYGPHFGADIELRPEGVEPGGMTFGQPSLGMRRRP